MTRDSVIGVRPRTLGEILDDAWRLYLADMPQLLLLSGLFNVPAAVALLLLLTQPRPDELAARCVLPALTALLLPLTGLGSGACQELFRRRLDGQPAPLGACLKAALRRGPEHVAARGLFLVAVVIGSACLAVPGLAVWMFAGAVHPFLASGEGRLQDALQALGRETPKLAVATLGRLILLLFVVINLHLLLGASLWIAGNLGGFDTALLAMLLSPGNLPYDIALLLLAWLLLAPFSEAANLLLFLDARVRHEGFDLWQRVQRLFPTMPVSRASLVLLSLAGLLGAGASGHAADDRLTVLREVRQELGRITQEVKAADPYPGGDRWAGPLRRLSERLEQAEGTRAGRYRWFAQALDSFARRNRDDAVQVLADLDHRLALVEESLTPQEAESSRPLLSEDEIKRLLPEEPSTPEAGDADAKDKAAKKAERTADRPVRREVPGGDDSGQGPRRGSGGLAPRPDGGFSTLGWMVLGGMLLAVLVASGLLLWQHRGRATAAAARPTGTALPGLEELLAQPQPQTLSALWQQAEELAQRGHHLEAVRTLYLAVLAGLHRANLIRYERTRTNGEYVRQVRLAPEAPEPLATPFYELTNLFDVKWYGERACQPEDYAACRGLAEEIRDLVAG